MDNTYFSNQYQPEIFPFVLMPFNQALNRYWYVPMMPAGSIWPTHKPKPTCVDACTQTVNDCTCPAMFETPKSNLDKEMKNFRFMEQQSTPNKYNETPRRQHKLFNNVTPQNLHGYNYRSPKVMNNRETMPMSPITPRTCRLSKSNNLKLNKTPDIKRDLRKSNYVRKKVLCFSRQFIWDVCIWLKGFANKPIEKSECDSKEQISKDALAEYDGKLKEIMIETNELKKLMMEVKLQLDTMNSVKRNSLTGSLLPTHPQPPAPPSVPPLLTHITAPAPPPPPPPPMPMFDLGLKPPTLKEVISSNQAINKKVETPEIRPSITREAILSVKLKKPTDRASCSENTSMRRNSSPLITQDALNKVRLRPVRKTQSSVGKLNHDQCDKPSESPTSSLKRLLERDAPSNGPKRRRHAQLTRH